MNLHRGYCVHCGPSVFHRRSCFMCGHPASADEVDIHVKEVHHRRKITQSHGVECVEGAPVTPSAGIENQETEE